MLIDLRASAGSEAFTVIYIGKVTVQLFHELGVKSYRGGK